MYQKVALVCFVLVSVAWAQTATSPIVATTRRPSQIATSSLSNAIKGLIGLFNSTAHLSGKVATGAVSGFIGAGQQISNSVAGIKSAALEESVNMLKQGVDIGTNMTALIPVVNTFANMGGNMVKAGGDVANMMGQAAISAGQSIVNGKLSLANGLVQAGAGLATAGVSTGSDMAMKVVDMKTNMVNSAFGTAIALADSAINSIDQASQSVSNMASNAASSLSVSSGNRGRSVQATVSTSG